MRSPIPHWLSNDSTNAHDSNVILEKSRKLMPSTIKVGSIQSFIAQKVENPFGVFNPKNLQSCCIGDIGTHAFQMLEYVMGQKIKTILADLNIYMKTILWTLMVLFYCAWRKRQRCTASKSNCNSKGNNYHCNIWNQRSSEVGARKPQLFILWFRKYPLTGSQTRHEYNTNS